MWNVLFSSEGTIPRNADEAIIFPFNTGWNDFGYKFQAMLRIFIKGKVCDFSIKAIPIKEDIIQDNLPQWVTWLQNNQAKLNELPINLTYPPFVSLFTNAESYKDLAASLEPEKYEDLLQKIYEINAYNLKEKLSEDDFTNLVTSSQFMLGVLRESGPYMSFRFGYNSSRRLAPPDDTRIAFSFSTTLDGNESPHAINFSYKDNELFQDRVHCIIGVNGSGKTSYLKNLICAMKRRVNLEKADQSILYDRNNIAIPDTLDKTKEIDKLPLFSRVVSYSSDPHNILPRKVDHNGSFEYLYSDMGLERNTNLTTSLADIIRNDYDFIGEDSRYTALKKVLQDVVPLPNILIPITKNVSGAIYVQDGYRLPIGALRGGEQHKLEMIGIFDNTRDLTFRDVKSTEITLSSGQKIYFQFAMHFLTYVRQGSVVIIDEPETHLHPNLITEFMSLLYTVLEATSSTAIIATHSAYVVREAPTHCVHIIQQNENKEIKISNSYTKTLGANVSSLSNFVFSDPLIESFNNRIAKHAAKSGLSFSEIVKQHGDFMSIDMLMNIQELMKDKE